jgi:phospholipase/carboxylesterase
MRRVTRRRFTLTLGGALAGAACSSLETAVAQSTHAARLSARPRPAQTSLRSGPLGLAAGGRDGIVQLPAEIRSGMPLLVFLHGATQDGARMLQRIGPAADRAGVVLVAPDSRERTWDAITGNFGDDVAFLDRALEFVFARLDVDASRVVLGGFSDGASYALSLGMANGDLFPRVIACSPGFVIPTPTVGRPRIFVSHGTADPILPIDECSRVIVPRLRGMSYDVTYSEFPGRHEIPPAVADAALAWMVRRS